MESGQTGHMGEGVVGLGVQVLLCSPPSKEKANGCWTRAVADSLPLLPGTTGQCFQRESNSPLPIPMSATSEREGDRETGSPPELFFPS